MDYTISDDGAAGAEGAALASLAPPPPPPPPPAAAGAGEDMDSRIERSEARAERSRKRGSLGMELVRAHVGACVHACWVLRMLDVLVLDVRVVGGWIV